MDEEDLAQMKEDRILENTETFKSDRIGSTKAELADRSYVSPLSFFSILRLKMDVADIYI